MTIWAASKDHNETMKKKSRCVLKVRCFYIYMKKIRHKTGKTTKENTLLPSIFMTGVQPPSPHPKSPMWQKMGTGFESRRSVTTPLSSVLFIKINNNISFCFGFCFFFLLKRSLEAQELHNGSELSSIRRLHWSISAVDDRQEIIQSFT